MQLPTLSDLLKRLVEMGGSDLHITTNSPPRIRIHGELKPLDDLPTLGPAETKQLAYSVLTESQKHRFEETLELDFSFGIRDLARFRGNLFNQRGSILVTGPTGSGKSTTLATMLDLINETRYEHMITIEDPIEFLHNHKRCL